VRRFVSADGLEILVGGDARENDHLTFRIARGSDLWLHAREAAGAHVVVRLPRGKSAPLETLLDAASLAAHFSRMRDAEKVDVLYVEAKLVRKTRGAPAGLVLVAGGKTIRVARDAARRERLLRPPPAPIDLVEPEG
jgi:predicted ribosome quality control (RQC) complex YloA/Tae2 family protein